MWLNVQLTQERQTYSEIQPKYLQELHQAKFEVLPELLDMLKENFLQDDDGKWYVPNLSDKADLEKLRRKRLLKDFMTFTLKALDVSKTPAPRLSAWVSTSAGRSAITPSLSKSVIVCRKRSCRKILRY